MKRVGVLGGGQLGRMLALAGYPLGLRFRFLEPAAGSPVSGLGEVVTAAYDDLDAAVRFADGLDVVTYEFENVPVRSAQALAERIPVRPPPGALQVAQDRVLEKQAFEGLGIPTAPYMPVGDRDDLESAVARIGLPAVLKTRRLGYDGKGQVVLRAPAELEGAWARLGGKPLILERFVDFTRELSLVGARGTKGETAFYPLVENEHTDGILRLTVAPAPLVSDALQARAEEQMRALMESLDYVGVMALEFFQQGDELLANELAPRVHNSGHWTLNGAACSQFENHLRAICGFPLGATEALGHSAMVNLIGRLPALGRVLGLEGVHLHLYDKSPRKGRKVGHVNLTGRDPADVRARIERLEALLEEGGRGEG